ncbi:hypothetical protein AURDEDRAFT_159492 [Auricularia subglabra TFB-10046 SS5]|nr:hypothetical protein AURDEDRAFT_159492 [Auricularia subglabra TFB-10046 SS5]
MAAPKPSLLSALLRPNLWTDYLIGMVMVALTVDIEDTYRMFVTEMKLAVDRVEALGLGDIPTANAIQARVDRCNEIFANPRHMSWFLGMGLRLEMHIWTGEGMWMADDMVARSDSRR